MNEFEKAWEEYKMPGDRISHKFAFKAGFTSALGWALSNKTDSGYVGEVVIVDIIEKELLNNQTDNSPD